LLGSNQTIILDSGNAGGGGVVPFLPLDQFVRPAQPKAQQPQPKAGGAR
jgi:hypothetical protein